MTLDEAIKHAEEVAEKFEGLHERYENMDEDRLLFRVEENECKNCAKEHRQLANWLKELKQLREQKPCEDCISREALLDKKWDVPYEGKYIQVVDVGDIKELPSVTRKKEEWIPCSERMPKQNECIEYYLIQDEYGDMYVARYTSDEWISIDSILQDNIVAWMPLPEPYKEETEREE